MKYFFSVIILSFLILNCNLSEGSDYKKYAAQKINTKKSLIDSIKYKEEIIRLEALFSRLYATGEFNGNVLIAKDNDIIYQKSFGYSIKETKTLLCDSSIFQLASVSKVITGVAALKLYEEGKLHLETKVCDILTDFPYKNVTVKHLLTHRSGLPHYTYFSGKYVRDTVKCVSNQCMLDIMVKHKPMAYAKAGLRFEYSNTNYALLALIIEKLSGKNYSKFLKEDVFQPLGMKHSYTALDIDSTRAHITHGYTMKYGWVANDKYDGIVGDKGIYTSTYDLYLLSTALFNQKFLNQTTLDLAYSPHSKEVKESNYGFGWRMRNISDDEKEVFHNGWWHGYRNAYHRRLKDNLTIIVLSNRLNKSVYNTWLVYDAIDGVKPTLATNKDTQE